MSYWRFGRARSIRGDRTLARARSLRSDRAPARAQSLRSDRALARAQSLCNDRAEHVFGCCVATLFDLLSDDSCFFRKAFRKEESISKKYLSKKVSSFSSSGILMLTSLQPFSTPTRSAKKEATPAIKNSPQKLLTLRRLDERSAVSGSGQSLG